jgi:RNA polymerase sigma-70 factor (ECF subfamily)
MSTLRVTVAVADLVIGPSDVGRRESAETPEVRGLVAAARAGDADAFGRLVDMFDAVAIRTALAALSTPQDAEDVAQDAFVIAWNKLHTFRGDASFKTWLLTIVWRKALDRRLWQRRWRLRSTQAGDDSDHFIEIADSRPTPERALVGAETKRRIEAEIRRLSPKLRDALLLAASGDHSYEQIAEILHTRVGTIKWRVSEARRIVAARVGWRQS